MGAKLRRIVGVPSVSDFAQDGFALIINTAGTVYTIDTANVVRALTSGGSGTPASTVVTETAFGQASAVGVGTNYAREDHTHGTMAAPTSVSGNAGTATALQTARTINGVSFDGTGNITVTAAGSTLTGTTIAVGMLGTSASTAAAGNDSRLSDARTPTAHATSHKSGGSDAIKLDELAAPTDVTTLNATTAAHGLMPKGTGSTTTFFRSDMTQAAVADPASQAYSPGSFTVATEKYAVVSRHLKLTTTQRATLAGTATLRMT